MTVLDRAGKPAVGYVADTTPYAWPWNGNLNSAGTAVLVVSPAEGVPAIEEQRARGAIESAIAVATSVAAAGGLVVHVITQPPAHVRADATDPVDELSEFSAVRSFARLNVDETISAQGFDGFFNSPLDVVLRRQNIERLILVGVGLETSIHSTMRSANDRGYECLLVRDACLSYEAAMDAPAVSMIEMSGGIFGAVGSVDAVVAAFAPQPQPEPQPVMAVLAR